MEYKIKKNAMRVEAVVNHGDPTDAMEVKRIVMEHYKDMDLYSVYTHLEDDGSIDAGITICQEKVESRGPLRKLKIYVGDVLVNVDDTLIIVPYGTFKVLYANF